MQQPQQIQSKPLIAVTLADPSEAADPDLARRRNDNYAAAVERHGGAVVRLTSRTASEERDAAVAKMDGLLLSGGADLDPARYGQPMNGARDVDPARDELEAAAFRVARARDVPVLGICRGLQAINVFAGGTLLQHVEGHSGAAWDSGPATTHPLVVVRGTRLEALLARDTDEQLEVNAYHHQGILASDLADGLRAAAWADSPAGPLIEGIEAADGRFVVGVQCHPERTESTPAAFERLFAGFVAAAAARAGARDAATRG
ncbi:MAG: gamma-glutamyl-gamma-aminobutyrate hydrolase family protein [Chloroflexota bacterium]